MTSDAFLKCDTIINVILFNSLAEIAARLIHTKTLLLCTIV